MAERLKFKDRIGYALGDAGGVMSFGMMGAFLQMFYTDVLHLTLGSISLLMLAARVWDAVNDPIWGSIIDRRKVGRHGKFRPYLLWGAVPLALSAALMFTKIPGLSQTGYLVYAWVTYILYGMMYTMVNIPYGSMLSVITDDGLERTRLSLFRSVGSSLGGLPGQLLLPLFVFSTAATGAKYLDGRKLSLAALALGALSLLAFFLCFKFTKERIAPPAAQKKIKLAASLRGLLHNRPFLALCLVAMLMIAASMYTQTLYNYLYKNYFGTPGLYSLVTLCTYAPMALALPFTSRLVARYEKKALCAAGLLLSAAANFAAFAVHTQSPYVFLIFCAFSGLGLAFLTLQVWALVTDVIDYQARLSRQREEGTSYALFMFTRKLGQTVAGSGTPALLLMIGYDVDKAQAVQTAAVLDSMYTLATLLPALLYLLMFAALAFLYPLGKKQLEEMRAEDVTSG